MVSFVVVATEGQAGAIDDMYIYPTMKLVACAALNLLGGSERLEGATLSGYRYLVPGSQVRRPAARTNP